jgi:hypothetical protein
MWCEKYFQTIAPTGGQSLACHWSRAVHFMGMGMDSSEDFYKVSTVPGMSIPFGRESRLPNTVHARSSRGNVGRRIELRPATYVYWHHSGSPCLRIKLLHLAQAYSSDTSWPVLRFDPCSLRCPYVCLFVRRGRAQLLVLGNIGLVLRALHYQHAERLGKTVDVPSRPHGNGPAQDLQKMESDWAEICWSG